MLTKRQQAASGLKGLPGKRRKIKAAWPFRRPGLPIPKVMSTDPPPYEQYGYRFAYLRVTREFKKNVYTLWAVTPEGERRLDPADPVPPDIMGVVG